MRNSVEAVQFRRRVLGIENLWPSNLQIFDGFLCIFRLVPCGYTKYLESFILVLVIHFCQYRGLCTTGAAPACPEVNQYIIPFSYIVGEGNLFAIFGFHCKVGERLSDGRLFQVGNPLAQFPDDVPTLDKGAGLGNDRFHFFRVHKVR